MSNLAYHMQRYIEEEQEGLLHSFGNIGIGPVIGIDSLEDKKSTLQSLTNRGLVVIACITDTKHNTFKTFIKAQEDLGTIIKTVAIFVTVYYYENYE